MNRSSPTMSSIAVALFLCFCYSRLEWKLFCVHVILFSACMASTGNQSTENAVERTDAGSLSSEKSSHSKNSNAAETCWPKENFALMEPTSGCPQDDWLVGTVTHTLKRNSALPEGHLINATVDGAYMTVNFCAHPRHHDCLGAPDEFPSGSYCLYTYRRQPHTKITQNCPVNFRWSWVAIDDLNVRNKNARSGHTPLGEYFSFATVQYFCCREDGDLNEGMVLPTKKPFILFPTMTTGQCQKVKGMVVKKTEVFYHTADDNSASNGAPAAPDFLPPEYRIDVPKDFWGQGLRLSVCYYSRPDMIAGVIPTTLADDVAVSQVDLPVCWPNENFALFEPRSGCPTGDSWFPGFVQHWEGPKSSVPSSALNATINGNTMTVGFCSHNIVEKEENLTNCAEEKTAKFQPGSYCVFLGHIGLNDIFDESCPQDFVFSWFVIDDHNDLNHENKTHQHGSVPEGEYYDFATVYYACCRDDGNVEKPISLPNSTPFVLMPSSTDRKCQAVVGMRSEYLNVFFDSEDQESDVIPLPPSSALPIDFFIENPKGKWGAGMHVKVCHYTPESYSIK